MHVATAMPGRYLKLVSRVKELVCPHCSRKEYQQLCAHCPIQFAVAELSWRKGEISDWRVKKIIAFVDMNYREALRVSELGPRVNLSTSRLQHIFKTELGIPISQYIREVRLKHASALLRWTGLRISEVCYSVGYESPAHFAREFKVHFSESPREYRQKVRAIT